MQTFFTSNDFQQYFVVQVPSNDDEANNENQPARANLALRDTDNIAIIKHEWVDTRKKYQQELEIVDEKMVKTD